jgi:hypothetical protein
LYPTKEKTYSVVSHKETKNSSIVSYNGKKPLLLYLTTEENLFHCGIQWKKTCGIVGFNAEDFSALHPTILLCCIYYEENVILRCGIQCRKPSVKWDTVHCMRFCCGVGYNRRKISALWDTTEKNLLAIQRLFSVVSHNGKNLCLCVPQRRKTFSVVSLNGKTHPLYPTTEKNLFLCIPKQQKNLKLK